MDSEKQNEFFNDFDKMEARINEGVEVLQTLMFHTRETIPDLRAKLAMLKKMRLQLTPHLKDPRAREAFFHAKKAIEDLEVLILRESSNVASMELALQGGLLSVTSLRSIVEEVYNMSVKTPKK